MDTAVPQCLEAMEANTAKLVGRDHEGIVPSHGFAAHNVLSSSARFWCRAPVFTVDGHLLDRSSEPLSHTGEAWLSHDMLPLPDKRFVVEFDLGTSRPDWAGDDIDRLVCFVDVDDVLTFNAAWRMRAGSDGSRWRVSRFSATRPRNGCAAHAPSATVPEHRVCRHHFTAVSGTLALLVLLATPHATRDTRSAPHKLNARRQQKGRPPIPEHHVVHLDLGARPATASEGSRSASHARALPRPHWRRGHVRRLPSGERTRVSPTIVGVDPAYREQLKEAIPKPHYRVQTS